jgi:hypothetical protein
MKTLEMPVSLATNRESLPLLFSPTIRINRRLSSLWYNKRKQLRTQFRSKEGIPIL